ncbi:threonine synthase [Denitromonas ohlonensis]|uniref:Threonine synthase n=2 Tax=Denitromonas TaxID=139331 RepID=A0A558CM41_9RHOO|nr:threonine synthase [Denitromonas ohlonensis]TVO65969.1 threonine synthase [Denitromonas ohlonensis]TVO79562.1 threonine synthase [Denitromonas ohlonensis]TVT49853.1 MAG: threonine synthase [Denitromonas halophila]TVT67591.1 MAG: threonine synthase [Denitromonas halophila]
MRYLSTRGRAPDQQFCDILLGGLAPDGGLYLPETYPKVSAADLAAWRTLSYADLAFEILSRFIDDIPAADLRAICQKTYTPAVYCNTRAGSDARAITPVTWLEAGNGPNHQGGLALLELSNGPTLAFKDMAMQLLGNLFEYVLDKRGEQTNILGATSGDTGSAAEYAMRGKHGVRVFMLSPHGRMSAFQRAQMYSLQDDNIFNIAVKGMFDDAQDIVKAVSNDHAFKAKYKIGAVNSINWGRVVAQIVYYFAGYFGATTSDDQQVDMAVPSGNFGNICAGHIARMMGLPIRQLICATNENDVLDEFFRTGVYRPRSSAETHVTSSPSMDISKASNFERFVFDLVGRDPAVVCQLWQQVESGGSFDLNDTPYRDALSGFGFVSGSSSHADRLETIRATKKAYGVVVDTHTADGLKVAVAHRDAAVPVLVLETAQAVKFEETIREALNEEPPRPDGFAHLESLPQRCEVMAVDVDVIKDFIRAHVAD